MVLALFCTRLLFNKGAIVVYYNSFGLDFKSPFGAVVQQTPITFQFKAAPAATGVWLVIYADGQWQTPTKVALAAVAAQTYRGEFIPTQAGLYFYYFQITQAGQTFYYGCQDGGYGGTGVVYQARAAVQMYQLTVLDSVETPPQWYQQAIFYHIFVDRFANGNADGHVNAPKPNSFIYGTKQDRPLYVKDASGEVLRWDFYGGNLKGIMTKLDYLQELGVTALFLSPIFEAVSNHRYDTGDYLKLEPMLGSLADFDALLQEVHRRGMHLILDGVFNHVGANSRYFNLNHTYDGLGASESPHSPYYNWFNFTDFPAKYKSWWGVTDLPTVDKNNTDYQQFIYGPAGVIEQWTQRGVDGWRLDVADELPDFFIHGIRQRLDQYPQKVLIGEVWEDASHKIAYNQRRHYLAGGMLHAVMNYPLRQLILDVLQGKIDAQTWVRRLLTLKENYPRSTFQYNFNNLGTHDTKRILTILAGDYQHLALATQLLLTLPGVPCLYYGDEAGLTGDVDPDNRRFFPWENEDPQTMQLYRHAIQLRHERPWLATSAFQPFYFNNTCFGYLRYADAHHYSIFLLNVGTTAQRVLATELVAPAMSAQQLTLVQQCCPRELAPGSLQIIDN